MSRCRTSALGGTAIRGEPPKTGWHWVKEVKAAMAALDIDPAFAERSVNEGFRREEALRDPAARTAQLQDHHPGRDRLRPDVDALLWLARGRYAESQHGGIPPITHYTRILRYIHPEYVHVFVAPHRRVRWFELADESDCERLRVSPSASGR